MRVRLRLAREHGVRGTRDLLSARGSSSEHEQKVVAEVPGVQLREWAVCNRVAQLRRLVQLRDGIQVDRSIDPNAHNGTAPGSTVDGTHVGEVTLSLAVNVMKEDRDRRGEKGNSSRRGMRCYSQMRGR